MARFSNAEKLYKYAGGTAFVFTSFTRVNVLLQNHKSRIHRRYTKRRVVDTSLVVKNATDTWPECGFVGSWVDINRWSIRTAQTTGHSAEAWALNFVSHAERQAFRMSGVHISRFRIMCHNHANDSWLAYVFFE